jgi:hypothetical protein
MHHDQVMTLLGDNTSGGITPAALRNAINEFYNRTYTVSVKEFGAIGDGQSHTLSSLGYATLAAAQAKFPSAKALTDEADWAAHQSAVDSLRGGGAGKGGVVFTPAGRYRFNRSLRLPKHHWGESENETSVGWIGEGSRASVIELRADFQDTARYYSPPGGDSGRNTVMGDPNGKFAVMAMDGVDPDMHGSLMDVVVAGLGFVGPGTWATSWPLGSTNGYTTKGVIATDRVKLREVWISGFYTGLAIDGGQTLYRDIEIDNCYYGIYFHWRNVFNHGDARFWGIHVKDCKIACVAIDDTVGHFHSYSFCSFKNSPYAFVKETGSGVEEWNYNPDAPTPKTSPHRGATLKTAPMTHCHFENIGNSIVQDSMESYSDGIRELILTNCSFKNIGNGLGPTAPASGMFRNAATLHTRNTNNIHFYGSHFNNMRPVAAGTFFSTNAPFNVQIDNVDPMIEECETANKPFFTNAGSTGAVRLAGTTWTGTVMFATGAIPRYSLVQMGGDARAVVAATESKDVIGVTQQTAVGNVTVMAQNGSTLVRCTTQPTAVGTLLKLDPANAGKVTPASGSTDGNVVGVCTNVGSGGLCTIYLRF